MVLESLNYKNCLPSGVLNFLFSLFSGKLILCLNPFFSNYFQVTFSTYLLCVQSLSFFMFFNAKFLLLLLLLLLFLFLKESPFQYYF